MTRGLLASFALPLMAFFAGCTQTGLTKPQRSAVEQLLISTAADQALERADWSTIRGKKVYVDRAFYESTDYDYVIGSIRDHVSVNGGLLMAEIALSVRAFVPVRGDGAAIHLVVRDERSFGPAQGVRAVCGMLGRLEARYGRRLWRRVRSPGATHCLGCWADANRLRGRVDWG